MDALPNPNSDEFGQLIDRYLADRRRAGWNSRQIQREAQYLGDAAANHWNPPHGASERALHRFVRWRETATRENR